MSDVPGLKYIRSKNAGPFWVTIDLFCAGAEGLALVSAALTPPRVAKALATPVDQVKRFELQDLSVIKLSIPRPVIQGAREDRDMHGASFALAIQELLANQSAL